jgi:hypothetical protein
MAKKNRASKMYEEEEEQKGKLSINNLFAEKEDDDLMSINMALEKEKEKTNSTEEKDRLAQETEDLEKEQREKAETEAASKGVKVPEPQAKRDPKKDKDPIEGKDLGLTENDFLLSRKVTIEDLDIHNQMNQEALLGSNVRKPKDFMNVFSRGPSSKDSPKVDTMYDIENNQVVQNKVAAKQLLRNYHSKDSTEKSNTLNIFSELNLDKEILKDIKADKNAYKNDNLIDIIKELL